MPNPEPDRSRGSILTTTATVALLLLAAWLALDRWVLAHARDPEPGVRATIWKRMRDLPPRPDGVVSKKATYRQTAKYFGPALTEAQLAAWAKSGKCSSLYDYLTAQPKAQVDQKLAELQAMLDQLGDALDEGIEQAKQQIRGTEDELVHTGDRSEKQNQELAKEFIARSEAAREMCVSDSAGGAFRNYRIRKEKHPRVYELRQQDADLNGIRNARLDEEIAQLILRESSKVIDTAAMDRVWQERLALARK